MNTIENVLKETLKSIVECGDIDEITLDSDLKNYSLDSIAFITLVVALENEFQVEFDDEDLSVNRFQTFQNLVDYIMLKLG